MVGPRLAVVAAAPARAGSEPHVGSVTATKGAKEVHLAIPITGADPGATITITDISGGGPGASTWELPVTTVISADVANALCVRNNNASGTYTATYLINPGGYTGTFVFTV